MFLPIWPVKFHMDLRARSVCPQCRAFLAWCPQVTVLLLMAGFPFSPDKCGWYFELYFLMVMMQLFIGMLATCIHSEEKYLSGPLSTFLNKRSFSYWVISSLCDLEMKALLHGLQAPFLALSTYLCPLTFAPLPLPSYLCPLTFACPLLPSPIQLSFTGQYFFVWQVYISIFLFHSCCLCFWQFFF